KNATGNYRLHVGRSTMSSDAVKRLWLKSRSHDVIMGYALATAILVIYTVIYFKGSVDNLPTTIFSTGTLVFAYFAYRFSREKFRLDLFEKRFAVYEATLAFCSRAMQGPLRAVRPDQRIAVQEALKSAEASFRGIGYHKARALFGKDIQNLLDRINNS